MIGNSTTSPLRRTALSSYRPTPMNWRQKGVGTARIIFGLVWVVDAILKWQPQFQNTFVDQVTAARDGQTGLIQGWISFWAGVVTINPLLFARIEATTETALAVFLILGIFSNLTFITGIFLSLGIWAIPEGLGGPYVPGQSTDIGTAFPYALIYALLLFLSAGSYYGLDRWLTSRLGRLGFLAAGSFWRSRKQV